jgi:hypothetical protein
MRDGGGKKLGHFGGISGTRDVVEQWKATTDSGYC